MFIAFIAGIIIGGISIWGFIGHYKRRYRRAVEDRQLLQQEKQIVVEFMHNMVEAVGDGVEREQLFDRIVHAAILSTGALSACLFERTGQQILKGAAVEGLFPPQRPLPRSSQAKLTTRAKFIENILKSETYRMGEGVIGSVAKSREALLIEDATSDPRVIQHDDPSLVVRSLIVAPIVFRDELLGVLAVANPSDGLSFNETDFSLVESLAEQVGLAIHNSRMLTVQLEKNRLDLDLELASSIQGLLLPDAFPASEKLDFASAYRPAQKIGGDLFDVFELSENRVGLAIADVSGKGISASILMAICQTNLRHYAQRVHSPSQVLAEVNSAMQGAMREDMFITVTYAIIDLSRDEITIARAGHELPIIVRNREGRPLELIQPQCEGMAIGMAPPDLFTALIADTTIEFCSGDSFVLYTDGVTETVNPQGTEYSTSRLLDTLRSVQKRPASGIVDGVLESIERFGESRGQTDDVTFLIAKYR